MKKWLKWTLGAIGTLVLIIVIFTIWNWDTISIISGTEGVSEDAKSVPKAENVATIPLEQGEADWPSWYGPDGEKRSLVTGINTDWSKGLTKKW